MLKHLLTYYLFHPKKKKSRLLSHCMAAKKWLKLNLSNMKLKQTLGLICFGPANESLLKVFLLNTDTKFNTEGIRWIHSTGQKRVQGCGIVLFDGCKHRAKTWRPSCWRTGYWAAGPTAGWRCRSHRWAAELETQTPCPTHLLLDGTASQEEPHTRP